MKKIVILFILSAALGIGIPGVSVANISNSPKNEIQQTVQQHKVYKKKRTRRHVTANRNARIQMQQRQAQKHLADERKVQAVQQEEKKHEQK